MYISPGYHPDILTLHSKGKYFHIEGIYQKKVWMLHGYVSCPEGNRLVVSNIFYFHPYLGKIPILTNIFQLG